MESISRKHFLRVSGARAAALLVPGCGFGGGDHDSKGGQNTLKSGEKLDVALTMWSH